VRAAFIEICFKKHQGTDVPCSTRDQRRFSWVSSNHCVATTDESTMFWPKFPSRSPPRERSSICNS
jgi:hypothetical protein